MKTNGIVFELDHEKHEIPFRMFRTDRNVSGNMYIFISKFVGIEDRINFRLYAIAKSGANLVKEATVDTIQEYYDLVAALEKDLKTVEPNVEMVRSYSLGFSITPEGKIIELPEKKALDVAKKAAEEEGMGLMSLLKAISEVGDDGIVGPRLGETKKKEKVEEDSSQETSDRLRKFMQ